MLETPDELTALQSLLDASHARATEHLRGIVTDDRRLTAADLIALLTAMRVINVATVTAAGEPRISALDGFFLHGSWIFSTSGDAAKARHIQARPAVSIAHVDGEELAVFSHGTAVQMQARDADWGPTLTHLTGHYGSSPLDWGDDIRLYRYHPDWMVGYAANRSQLLASRVA